MIHALQCNLYQVIFWIVRNAEQRQPICFDLITYFQRRDLDLGPLTDELAR